MSWNSFRSVISLFLFTVFLFEMCTSFHVCFFICSSLKWLTGRPRAICGQRYPLPCFAWLWIGMRGSKEAALKGMKSCRTQGDFSLFVVCKFVLWIDWSFGKHPVLLTWLAPKSDIPESHLVKRFGGGSQCNSWVIKKSPRATWLGLVAKLRN